MGVYGGPEAIQDGLVLSLDAGNRKSYPGSGTTWTDISGSRNNGTLVSSPSYSSADGGYFNFNGTNYVNSLDVSSYVNLTVEMWLYDTRSSGERDILTYGGSYTFNGSTFRTDQNSIAGRSFSGVGQPPLNTWYRFCYIKNGDLYINLTKYTGSGADRPYGSFSFANTRSDVSNRLNGRISNIKVYNRSLSEDEIRQNYIATKSRYGL